MSLEKLSLSGTDITNLYSTVEALRPLKNLRVLSFQRTSALELDVAGEGDDAPSIWTGDHLQIKVQYHKTLESFDGQLSSPSFLSHGGEEGEAEFEGERDVLMSGEEWRTSSPDSWVSATSSDVEDEVLDDDPAIQHGEDEQEGAQAEEDEEMNTDSDDDDTQDGTTTTGHTTEARFGISSPTDQLLRGLAEQPRLPPIIEATSPICGHPHYREFIIHNLPQLKVLDDREILQEERARVAECYSLYFEDDPYPTFGKPLSVYSLARSREAGVLPVHGQPITSQSISRYTASTCFRPDSPQMSILCPQRYIPRQFEFNPMVENLGVVGTSLGELVLLNTETCLEVSRLKITSHHTSVLGLCWLRRDPSKFVAGTDSQGIVNLYDTTRMPLSREPPSEEGHSPLIYEYPRFHSLTSLHVNSTDERMIASGYEENMAVYDVGQGTRIRTLLKVHQKHINVTKFANTMPDIFASCSFDRTFKLWDLRDPADCIQQGTSSKGNVMICFSPDDQYLLVSAVDNEVKQYDVRMLKQPVLELGMRKVGGTSNYTRSYYMNNGDYIFTGSCEETSVKIFNTASGALLRDIELQELQPGVSRFVQSLRSDPHHLFRCSVISHQGSAGHTPTLFKIDLLGTPVKARDDGEGDDNRGRGPGAREVSASFRSAAA